MIWVKTDAGRAEMQTRSLVKERARRNHLLLIDGTKTEEMLLASLAGISADDFQELRRRYRGFAIPWTVAFLVWYLTYVIMSSWANDFMNTKIVGNINVALVFGLLQFATTFALAWVYSNYSTKHLDPLARQLDEDYAENRSNKGDDA